LVDAGSSHLQVALLGAAGTIAPAIVRDLAESEEVSSMVLLDLDEERASAVAETHGGGRATARAVDAADVEALAAALDGVDVLVNAASYRINLSAMQACLTEGCNYLDLGGLYWMTHRQLALSPLFEEARLVAVLGIGSSPGKTNLMAARAVRDLDDRAQTIEVAAAGRDFAQLPDDRLRPPYAIQTLLDELTMKPVVIRDSQAGQVAPLSPGGTVDFGPPIGPAETIFTLHSELATFSESFGCENATFRLSLAEPLLERLKQLAGGRAGAGGAAARGGGLTRRRSSLRPHGLRAPGERHGGERANGQGASGHRAPLRHRRLGRLDRGPGGRCGPAPRAGVGERRRCPPPGALHRSRGDVRRASAAWL
jgi:hypothetical protein